MGRIKPGRKVKVLPPPGSPNPLPGRSNFPASRPIESDYHYEQILNTLKSSITAFS